VLGLTRATAAITLFCAIGFAFGDQYNQPSPKEDYFDSFATSHTRVTGTDVQVSLSSNNTT